MDHAGCVRDTREGEREPVRMVGGSGWPTFQDETYTSGRCEQEAKGKGMTSLRASGKVVTDEQGARIVAGMLRNEPGALFYSAPFLFLSSAMLCFAPFRFQLRYICRIMTAFVRSCTPSKPLCASISCGRITRRSQTRSPAPNRFVWIRWTRSSGSSGS